MAELTERHHAHGSSYTAFAKHMERAVGHPAAFLLSLLVVVLWGFTGPLFNFSDTWQLVMNTTSSIVTFLMVFIIQYTQNRDTDAIQIKLDELLRAYHGAHTMLVSLEELGDEELQQLREKYTRLGYQARQEARRGRDDTGVPDLRIPK